MDHAAAIQNAKEIIRVSGHTDFPRRNFLEYGASIAYLAKGLSEKKRSRLTFNFDDWAYAWRDLCDRFDQLVTADPMMLYQPAHSVSKAFHSSNAYIRYFRAGNRTSKTQSGYAEHYFVTTGQQKWRWFPQPAVSTFIVAGLPFTTYAPGVFEKKFLVGEDASTISPMFPEGGKWFNHYDERQHCITIACPACAEAGKAQQCKHPKSTIRLFSNENGWEVLQGASYTLGHFDEHVNEDFFNEARQRTKTVPGGCLIVTGTPLHGYEAWEHRLLTRTYEAGPPSNQINPDDPSSPPLVSLHEIDQFAAGLVPHDQIKMEMALMDSFQIDSRVYGKPAPLADNPVFDRRMLQEMESQCRAPTRGNLLSPRENAKNPHTRKPLVTVRAEDKLEFQTGLDGPLRVWKEPEPNEIYIASVDTAGGLLSPGKKYEGDASCCSILRVHTSGSAIALELVAQWHGWITPYDYADEVFKVAVWYNSAVVVIELTGGLGVAVVQRLRNDHGYWNIYRETQDLTAIEPELDSRMGVDTNISTKPFMISALQQFIKTKTLQIYDKATISELVAFEQKINSRGGARLEHVKYQGAGGSKDDRVMSLAIGCVTAISYAPVLGQLAANNANMDPSKNRANLSTDMAGVYRDLAAEKGSQL
jgi:hypothetical protein